MPNVQMTACAERDCRRRPSSERGYCRRHDEMHARLDNCFAMVADMSERIEAALAMAEPAPSLTLDDLPEVLSVEEVATVVRRSRSSIYRDLAAGTFEIDTVRIGGRVRFAKAKVLRHLAGE